MAGNDYLEKTGAEKFGAIMRGPGQVAGEIADAGVELVDDITGGHADDIGGALDTAGDVISDGTNWIKDTWADLSNDFFGVNYDSEAQEAYANRDAIIAQFAVESRAYEITPETMRNMEYLQDAGVLDVNGDDNRSARIASGIFDRVKENPSGYGLKETETETYNNDTEDIPVFEVKT